MRRLSGTKTVVTYILTRQELRRAVSEFISQKVGGFFSMEGASMEVTPDGGVEVRTEYDNDNALNEGMDF